jgi:hypothetical protein
MNSGLLIDIPSSNELPLGTLHIKVSNTTLTTINNNSALVLEGDLETWMTITVSSGDTLPAGIAFQEINTTKAKIAYYTSTGIQIINNDANLNTFFMGPSAQQMIIYGNTNDIYIGDASGASAKLSVDQYSSTGAKPVLALKQSDVSEEFIRFVGTSANGVLTQSIVEDADVTTSTLQGWIKVYVQDDGNQLTDQAYYVPIFTLA